MLKADCGPGEKQTLLHWLGADTEEPDAVDIVSDYLEQNIDTSYIDEAVMAKLQYRLDLILNNRKLAPVHRVHLLRTAWFRVAVAAIILVGIGTYFWLQPSTDSPSITRTQPVSSKNDVLPGTNKAILTLADGQQIKLDSNANSLLAEKGIINRDASISYSGTGQGSVINTLATPRGGQYQIKLGDGTKVWLNAASSITYPTMFTGNKREVTITGEAYFEVTKNAKQPFVVETGSEQIIVLGTSFNVNNYSDEEGLKISLIDGAVKVNNELLRPGQGWKNGKISIADIARDIAWKNGYFSFRDADVKTIMRQLSRWYNVDVLYEGEISKREFNGRIGRELTMMQVLKILSGLRINYRLENSRIIILP